MMPIKTEEDGDDADADGMVKVDISDTNGPDKESLYLLKDQKKSSSGEEVNTRPNENKMKIFIISAVLGNILAWYDFGVFASFSSELSRAFFTGEGWWRCSRSTASLRRPSSPGLSGASSLA